MTFDAGANTGAARSGNLTIAGETVTVNQDAACSLSVTPTLRTVGSSGGTVSFSVAVTTGAACTWTASTSSSFLSITSGGSGTDAGTVIVEASANSGGGRSGTVTIAGQTVTVSQAAPSSATCGFGVTPSVVNLGAGGTSFSVSVTNVQGFDCNWTASSNAAFLSVTSGGSGTGNGVVNIAVAANSGSGSRSGTLTIAGLPVTVNQDGGGSASPPPTSPPTSPSPSPSPSVPCGFGVAPAQIDVGAGGGTYSLNVVNVQGSGCSWTASSNSSFVSVTGGASGSGNGSVTISVAANSDTASRSGSLTVAGLPVRINQVGVSQPTPAPPSCGFGVAPSLLEVGASGGSYSFNVVNVQGTNCSWSASTSASFVSITGGASGTGNGSVTISVAANSGAARTGSMTIAGLPVTVKQSGS